MSRIIEIRDLPNNWREQLINLKERLRSLAYRTKARNVRSKIYKYKGYTIQIVVTVGTSGFNFAQWYFNGYHVGAETGLYFFGAHVERMNRRSYG